MSSVAENVLFVEKAPVWGSKIDPFKLSFQDLKLHLHARGVQNVSGTRGELAVMFQKHLKKEEKEAWGEWNDSLSKSHKRLKHFTKIVEEEDASFHLSKVNVWIREFEQRGAWNWAKDSRSLAFRSEQEKRRYEIACRARQRKSPKFSSKLLVKAEAEKLKKLKDRKGKRDAHEHRINIKAESCKFLSSVDGVNYYCVNRRFRSVDGHEMGTCAFHATTCSDVEYHDKHKDDVSLMLRIEHPNEHALCLDCYRRRTKRRPVILERHQCPGTHVLRSENVAQVAQVQDHALSRAGELDKPRVKAKCSWEFTTKAQKRFHCTNDVLQHGQTVCGYHTKFCEMKHPGAATPIEEPNELGMCRSHYTARMKRSPLEQMKKWPLVSGEAYPPGVMEIKPKQVIRKAHTLRPREGKKVHVTNVVEPVEYFDEEMAAIDAQVIKLSDIKKILDYIPKDEIKSFLTMHIKQRLALGPQNAKKFRANKVKLRKFLFGSRYATDIQRVFRGLIGRRLAQTKLTVRLKHHRWNATIAIQTQVRGVQTRVAVSKHRKEFFEAVDIFQRVMRGHLTRRRMKKTQAVISIQKVVRGFMCRLDLIAEKILLEFRNKQADAAWAQFVLIRHLKSFIRRWRAWKQADLEMSMQLSAIRIQALVRGMLSRITVNEIQTMLANEFKAAKQIQTFIRWRNFRVYVKKEKHKRVSAVVGLQKVWRGFRGRVRAMLKKESVEKAWRWLDPKRPRTSYDHLLPSKSYMRPILQRPPTMFWNDRSQQRLTDLFDGMKRGPPGQDDSEDEASEGDSGEDVAIGYAARMKEKEKSALWSKLPFLQFDPDGCGKIKRYEFGEALKKMGYRMAETQIREILKRWSRSDGSVNYLQFLEFVQQETYACAKHRAWACPTCVSYGHCVKCKCRRFHSSETHGNKAGRAICDCGHYIAMHNLVPKIHSEKVPGATLVDISSSEFLRMFTPQEPPEMPVGIQGTKLSSTRMTMHYNKSDLRVRAQTSIGGSRCRKMTPLQLAPAVNISKTESTKAFLQLSEKIIKDITKESSDIIRELKDTGDWNDSVNPLATYPGTAPSVNSHSKRGVGDIIRLKSSQSKQRPMTTSVGARVSQVETGRPETSTGGVARPSTVNMQGKARPGTTMATRRRRKRPRTVQADENGEGRARKAEVCPPEQLGSFLLSSATRPHTTTHTSRETNKPSGRSVFSGNQSQSPFYVKRLIRAEHARKELLSDLESKREWTNLEEFSKNFRVTDPVPLIVNDQLRMETNMAPLYIDMLLALSSEACGLLEDWPAFVAYVFQSFAFIGRHWRKLAFDLRSGTLDKNLPVDKKTRAAIEATLTPNPARATKFDKAMQRLGFYKGNVTQDIPVSLAEACVDPQETSSNAEVDIQAKLRELCKAKEERMNRLSKRHSSHNLLETVAQNSSKIEDQPTSIEIEFDATEEKKRREALSINDAYSFSIQPRVLPGNIITSKTRHARQYICSFPGCAKVFSDLRIAESHAQEAHTGKYRLAHEFIHVDERMQMYWPKTAPWVSTSNSKTLREREKAGVRPLYDPVQEALVGEQEFKVFYPYKCRRPSCTDRFKTAKELKAHIQANHERPEKLAEMIGVLKPTEWIVMRGEPISTVPPDALPHQLELSCCSMHWVLFRPNCEECQVLIKRGDPICPLQFYEEVRLHANEVILGVGSPSAPHFRKDADSPEHIGSVVALFDDKYGRKFVAYNRFNFQPDPLRAPAILPMNFQLFADNSRIYIAPLSHVVGMSFVLRCPRADYMRRRNSVNLPRLPHMPSCAPHITTDVYFCEEIRDLSRENGRFIPYHQKLKGT